MNNLQWINEAFFKTEDEANQLVNQLEVGYENKSFTDRPFKVLKHEVKKIEDFKINS